MALHPKTGELWAVVNERDQLGNDLVPDYLTRVNAQDDFGWPTYYWGLLQDPRVSLDWDDNDREAQGGLSAANAPVSDSQRPPMRPRRVPDYALGAHTASLGIAFYPNDGSIAALRGHAIISQRGSWNRNPRSGYQVIAIPFDSLGNPVGQPKPVLTGFLDEREQAMGRPVGVAIDDQGAVLIADDVGGILWRVTNAS
jgi:glucose/arabinose dehydrogenase